MDSRILLRLKTKKKTVNKIRWDTTVDDITFSLYIPKWRVPEPWPENIYLTIEPVKRQSKVRAIRPGDVMNDQTCRLKPIESLVEYDREHTETLRYCPLGNPDEWEIGQTYIPFSLTHDSAPNLKLKVFWGEQSGA